MPGGIRIDKTRTGIGQHLTHTLEHSRPRVHLHTGIADENDIAGVAAGEG
jgi:hypothetical protein